MGNRLITQLTDNNGKEIADELDRVITTEG